MADDNSYIIKRLREVLPATFLRADTCKLTGGIISVGHLANLDSRGEGPANVFYLGRRAVYTRESFLLWLEPRLTRIKAKPVNKAAQAA